jgi:hypothetical protein
MTARLLLWLTVVIFCFHLGGHLFDILANQPNWRSGEVADVSQLRDFYAKASPTIFFAIITISGPFVSLAALLSVWKQKAPVTVYLGIAFLIALLVLIWTVTFFVPINQYLFSTADYEPEKLSELVSRWITMEYFRVAVIALGTLSAILGVDAYYSNVAAKNQSSQPS